MVPVSTATSARKHLAGDEERCQTGDNIIELGFPGEKVILVGAIRGTLAIDIVAVELEYRAGVALGIGGFCGKLSCPQHNLVTCTVSDDRFAGSCRLR